MTKLQHEDSPEEEAEGEPTTAAEACAAEAEEAAKVEAEAAAAEAGKVEPRDQRQGDVDFTDHEPDLDLEDEFYGHFRSTEQNFSSKTREDGRYCSDNEFSRAGRGPKGWAAEPALEPLWRRRALWLVEEGKLPQSVAPPAAKGYLREERFQFYAQHTARRVQALVRRGYRPTKALEAQRFKKVAPKRFKKSPLLTNAYIFGEPRPVPGGAKRWAKLAAPQEGAPKSVRHALTGKPFAVKSRSRKEDRREEYQLLLARFEAEGGKVRVCPAEKTAAQIEAAPKKIGRPTKYGYVMSDTERQRRSRANRKASAPAPNRCDRPGAVEHPPIVPVAPGSFQTAIAELERLAIVKAIERADNAVMVSPPLVPTPEPAPAAIRTPRKLPWSTPTVTEIAFESLPTELRMMALGLPAPS